MYYQDVTVWTVIKRFLLGWLAAGAVLVLISCVRYRQCIAAAIANNTWAWINAGHADRHRDHHVVGADQIFFAITKGKKENACI